MVWKCHIFAILYCGTVYFRKVTVYASRGGSWSNSSPQSSGIFNGRMSTPYHGDDDDNDVGIVGTGREFALFGGSQPLSTNQNSNSGPGSTIRNVSSRDLPFRPGSSSTSTPPRVNGLNSAPPSSFFSPSSNRRSRSYNGRGASFKRGSNRSSQSFFQPVADWWTASISPNVKNWPKIQCRVEPTTTLKIRKTFRPLKTVVQLGADFNTQLGVWQFRSSWEDAIIGGKLTLAGRELQLSKSWQLSVGAVEDLVTRLRFRAAVDLQTWKAYARVGFRTERLSPINVMEGFTLLKQLPLDGNHGHVKLEVKANFALPEPEIEYSTETQRSLVGMGDIEVNIEELNLVLDY